MRMYVLDESPNDPRRYLFEGKMERVCMKILVQKETKKIFFLNMQEYPES